MTDDEYETNWHKYEEADAIVQLHEQLVTALEKFPDGLHRTLAKGYANECLRKAKEMTQDIWYLRRMCDQSAG